MGKRQAAKKLIDALKTSTDVDFSQANEYGSVDQTTRQRKYRRKSEAQDEGSPFKALILVDEEKVRIGADRVDPSPVFSQARDLVNFGRGRLNYLASGREGATLYYGKRTATASFGVNNIFLLGYAGGGRYYTNAVELSRYLAFASPDGVNVQANIPFPGSYTVPIPFSGNQTSTVTGTSTQSGSWETPINPNITPPSYEPLVLHTRDQGGDPENCQAGLGGLNYRGRGNETVTSSGDSELYDLSAVGDGASIYTRSTSANSSSQTRVGTSTQTGSQTEGLEFFFRNIIDNSIIEAGTFGSHTVNALDYSYSLDRLDTTDVPTAKAFVVGSGSSELGSEGVGFYADFADLPSLPPPGSGGSVTIPMGFERNAFFVTQYVEDDDIESVSSIVPFGPGETSPTSIAVLPYKFTMPGNCSWPSPASRPGYDLRVRVNFTRETTTDTFVDSQTHSWVRHPDFDLITGRSIGICKRVGDKYHKYLGTITSFETDAALPAASGQTFGGTPSFIVNVTSITVSINESAEVDFCWHGANAVNDVVVFSTDHHSTLPTDPSTCNLVKGKNGAIATIYATYIRPSAPEDRGKTFDHWVEVWSIGGDGVISPQLQPEKYKIVGIPEGDVLSTLYSPN